MYEWQPQLPKETEGLEAEVKHGGMQGPLHVDILAGCKCLWSWLLSACHPSRRLEANPTSGLHILYAKLSKHQTAATCTVLNVAGHSCCKSPCTWLTQQCLAIGVHKTPNHFYKSVLDHLVFQARCPWILQDVMREAPRTSPSRPGLAALWAVGEGFKLLPTGAAGLEKHPTTHTAALVASFPRIYVKVIFTKGWCHSVPFSPLSLPNGHGWKGHHWLCREMDS